MHVITLFSSLLVYIWIEDRGTICAYGVSLTCARLPIGYGVSFSPDDVNAGELEHPY